MADSKSDQKAAQEQQKAQAAQQQADQEATAQLNTPERANQAAERAPVLDVDLEETRKGDNDPTSQRAPARIHAMTTEYAGYINVGRPERAQVVEEQLAREGYSTEGIRLADSASLPQHVAEEENRRSPAERRRKAAATQEFLEVTGRRVPQRATAADKTADGKTV